MMSKKTKNKALPLPKQGEIWLVEFPKIREARKPIRPCLVISDNVQNECDEWIVVIPMTTEAIEDIEPFEVFVKNTKETGLDYPSKLQFNYPRTIDRVRLKEYLGVLNSKFIEEVKKAWKIAFDSENWEW